MYIERVRNRNSPPAILLRESYRQEGKVRKRTLANLSHWPSELVSQFEQLLKGCSPLEPLEETFEIVRSLPHGHVRAVLGTLQRLTLEKAIAQRATGNRNLVVAMIVTRILTPASKLTTARTLAPQSCTSTLAETLQVEGVSEDGLYRAMDWLLKRQSQIERRLAQQYLQQGSLVLFDLSSTYLEGEHCPLAKRGYNRDRKKGMVQIVFGVLCNAQGCPIAVEVFAGNTSDPTTLKNHLAKLKEEFNLKSGVLVGDRGMLPDKQIQTELKQTQGWEWITALKAVQIRSLLTAKAFQLETLHQTKMLEFSVLDYPEERLIACYNTSLATQRSQSRQALLQATEKELAAIVVATQRPRNPLQGKDQIALRIGKVVNRFKVAKHFQLSISETHFSYQRNLASIRAEADLDGIYIIRTSVKAKSLSASDVVAAYKSLSRVEQAFRCFKSVDLHIRPIFHRLEERVRAHVLLCLLAYHVEWHMRQALAPLLFAEDDSTGAQQQRASIVESAKKSDSAYRKATTKLTAEELPVHSFGSLLDDLATLTKNTIQPKQSGLPCFDKVSRPTPLQKRAFELLKVAL
jgi:transposase